jgi:6-pyruvoyltetrahydropterin/6-carboxytetrahydropterin synthase
MENEMLISREFKFDTAHRLPNYDGKCKNLHGHTFKLVVNIRGFINPETNMIIDFGKIKEIVTRCVLDKLDHHYINDDIPEITYPTAEHIIRWIWNQLVNEFIADNHRLFELSLYETETSWVSFRG